MSKKEGTKEFIIIMLIGLVILVGAVLFINLAGLRAVGRAAGVLDGFVEIPPEDLVGGDVTEDELLALQLTEEEVTELLGIKQTLEEAAACFLSCELAISLPDVSTSDSWGQILPLFEEAVAYLEECCKKYMDVDQAELEFYFGGSDTAPQQQTVTLSYSNTYGGPLKWQASSSDPSVTMSLYSGEIQADETQQITVTVDPNTAVPGTYSITFKDTGCPEAEDITVAVAVSIEESCDPPCIGDEVCEGGICIKKPFDPTEWVDYIPVKYTWGWEETIELASRSGSMEPGESCTGWCDAMMPGEYCWYDGDSDVCTNRWPYYNQNPPAKINDWEIYIIGETVFPEEFVYCSLEWGKHYDVIATVDWYASFLEWHPNYNKLKNAKELKLYYKLSSGYRRYDDNPLMPGVVPAEDIQYPMEELTVSLPQPPQLEEFVGDFGKQGLRISGSFTFGIPPHPVPECDYWDDVQGWAKLETIRLYYR